MKQMEHSDARLMEEDTVRYWLWECYDSTM